MSEKPKKLFWIASSRRDLSAMPDEVKRTMGFALWQAQSGKKHPDVKPLLGFGGTGVLEVVEDHDNNTFRTVYTVRFKGAVYVLHAFQKKSTKGRKTPKHEIDLVRTRLKQAEQFYEQWKQDHQETKDKP